MRPDNEHSLVNFGEKGGAGDNTVYEIFKAFEEVAVSTAYIRLTDGAATGSDNCRIACTGDTLTVECQPEVDRIHIFTERPLTLVTPSLPPTHIASGSHLATRREIIPLPRCGTSTASAN